MDAPEDRHTSSFQIDRIEYKRIKFHEQIGVGAFGAVHRVTFSGIFRNQYKGYKQAAAKSVFNLEEKEIKIMSKLKHNNIVTLIGFSQTEVTNVILMEYATNGSLHEYLADLSKPLSVDLQNKWYIESALAIQYLHSQNFLHRDIKPKNCLLFDDYLLKLCDFGLARELEGSRTTSEEKGTKRYMAQELIVLNERGRAVYSKPADIYAYGMLVLEIYTRKPPFPGWEPLKVVFEVGNGAQPSVPEDCPSYLADMMQQCWNMDPKERPTIEMIVETIQRVQHEGKVLSYYKNLLLQNREQVARYNCLIQGGPEAIFRKSNF